MLTTFVARLFIWCSVATLVACAPGGAARLPGAIDPAALDPRVGAFEWSMERRLTWADFRGRPDPMSDAVALTAYLLSYDVACDGRRFNPRVVTNFLPRVSWVKSSHLLVRRSVETLQHEQTHFDLSEVQARRARQTLLALSEPCARSDQEIDALLEGFARADAEVQQQYDRETGHGTNPRQQGIWDARVQEWLRAAESRSPEVPKFRSSEVPKFRSPEVPQCNAQIRD